MDIWALGVSAIEMAEQFPPRWRINPNRVIFMIVKDPPPRLADKDRWSLNFQDFVAQCLQKVRDRGRMCGRWGARGPRTVAAAAAVLGATSVRVRASGGAWSVDSGTNTEGRRELELVCLMLCLRWGCAKP